MSKENLTMPQELYIPTIWSRDTGQWRAVCFDSCQLSITWMPKIKDVAMEMVLLFFKILADGRTYVRMDICTVMRQPPFVRSICYHIF